MTCLSVESSPSISFLAVARSVKSLHSLGISCAKMSAGFVLRQTKGFTEAPISKNMPVLLGAFAATIAAAYLNSKAFTLPNSMTPEFQAEQARIGNVMERTNAPPVFLNPIMNKIPGNILGPDDLAQ